MGRIFKVLKAVFAHQAPTTPAADGLLQAGLNPASRSEIFYAELAWDRTHDKTRDYPWPPGWHG